MVFSSSLPENPEIVVKEFNLKDYDIIEDADDATGFELPYEFNVNTKYAVLLADFETSDWTGTGEIIELAVKELTTGIRFNKLIKPLRGINPQATAVHGYTEEMLKDCPP
jgi:DNA polymerase III epsilon subunit-like protein